MKSVFLRPEWLLEGWTETQYGGAKSGSLLEPVGRSRPFPLWLPEWIDSIPPEDITVWNSECYLIWNKGLCRFNKGKELKTRSTWMRVDPKPNEECPYKRQKKRRLKYTERKVV